MQLLIGCSSTPPPRGSKNLAEEPLERVDQRSRSPFRVWYLLSAICAPLSGPPSLASLNIALTPAFWYDRLCPRARLAESLCSPRLHRESTAPLDSLLHLLSSSRSVLIVPHIIVFLASTSCPLRLLASLTTSPLRSRSPVRQSVRLLPLLCSNFKTSV